MTPEQKERIQKAARELESALDDVKSAFEVEVRQFQVSFAGHPLGGPRTYRISITQLSEVA